MYSSEQRSVTTTTAAPPAPAVARHSIPSGIDVVSICSTSTSFPGIVDNASIPSESGLVLASHISSLPKVFLNLAGPSTALTRQPLNRVSIATITYYKLTCNVLYYIIGERTQYANLHCIFLNSRVTVILVSSFRLY